MSFEELCQTDSRLLALYQEAMILAGKMGRLKGYPAKPTPPNFCRYQQWHGLPHVRGLVGMLYQLQLIANTNPAISEHFELCYQTLFYTLPPCAGHESCRSDFPIPPESEAVTSGRSISWKRKQRTGFMSLIEMAYRAAKGESQ
jgi:hypothetical protein